MNELEMCGIDFIEFSSKTSESLEKLFFEFGFSYVADHATQKIKYFKQNDIHLFINEEPKSFARTFSEKHGPCLSSMGWRFKNPQKAFELAIQKGAKPVSGDYRQDGKPLPAIYGIGDSIIYFVSENQKNENYKSLDFKPTEKPILVTSKCFTVIDHLTNNVENGTMKKWSEFYKNIFGFTEVRYFDIRGAQTGLKSFALQSPCKSFCIPINEAKEIKSQINEYLEEYKGPGVQHLAFLTEDILTSLDGLKGSAIETLDIDNEYYAEIFNKFPQVTENHDAIKNHQVLVDGDDHGYLLQIFTKNLIGPIFIEIIQRKNHYSFGEGNFGALFRSIERDQIKRGYLNS